MDWFKRIGFFTASKKDVIQNNFLDDKTQRVLGEFDKEYRYKKVNNLSFTKDEVVLQLTYAATELWKYVVNASHDIYKKIQILEADYIDTKAKLDNAIEYELQNLEKKRQEYKKEIDEIDEELDEYNKQRKEIENAYHQLGEKKTLKGSLNRLHTGWFLFIMLIAGAAELFIYKNVFLSQEIGTTADLTQQEKWQVPAMALFMASGFTVMIIWLAHKMGEILRHLDSATQQERKGQWMKLGFIALIVSAAIWATVDIRGKMHQILAKDTKITTLMQQQENNEESLFADDTANDGFGDDTQEENDDGGFGAEDEDGAKQTKNPEIQIDVLRDEINKEKGATAWLFIIINLFIVVGGVFLSYETHTSSKIYETIERHIKNLQKRKKRVEQSLQKLEKEIVHFKEKKIDKIFKDLLLKSALYDKEIQVYNTYQNIYMLKLQTILEYLKNIYQEAGVAFPEITIEDILKGKIEIDLRKELHHVKNIDEYMIYTKDLKKQEV